jgi:DNA-binding NarL/FixJ family response regulator
VSLPLEVLIVSASPILSRSLQQLLTDKPHLVRCWVLDEMDAPFCPDVVLISPQNWQELAFWLPALQIRFPRCRWLVLGELRLAGMFLSALETHRCALVSSSAFPEELCSCLQVLAEEDQASPTGRLLALFARIAPPLGSGRQPLLLSPRELQCGCAASLGLSNRQIAHVLHLSEGTIKSHLHSLARKLELSSREELGEYFEQAFSPLSPPKSWSEIPTKSSK